MSEANADMLLDELDNQIALGRRMPLSNLVMVDRDRCLQLVAEIRAKLPGDITAAKSVIENQKNIINEARAMAEQTRNEANSRAARAVNEANAQAQGTVANANKQAQDMLQKANAQTQAMLAEAQEKTRRMIADAEARA